MPVKDNHPLLRKKIESFFESANLYQAEFAYHREVTVGRGRVEVRSLLLSDDLPRGFTGFAGVRQLFRLERVVRRDETAFRPHKKSGKEHRQVVLGMTSLPRSVCSAAELLPLLRGHWCIENRSHFVRDVTFGEDGSQVRVGNLPQVLAALRNAAIGLIRIAGWPNVAAARRYFAARPAEALQLMGCTITE
jgi:hypothetical protein